MTNVYPLHGNPASSDPKAIYAKIANGAANLREGWFEFGALAHPLRVQYPRNEDFSEALKTAGLFKFVNSNLEFTIHANTRAAAIWAVASPDEFAEAERLWPDIEPTLKGGFRGLYEKWTAHIKAITSQVTPQPAPSPRPSEPVAAPVAPEPAPTPVEAPVASPVPPVASPVAAPIPANDEPEPEIIVIEPEDPETDTSDHSMCMNIGYDRRVKGLSTEECMEKYGFSEIVIRRGTYYYDGYARARADIKIEAVEVSKTSRAMIDRRVIKEMRDMHTNIEQRLRDKQEEYRERYWASLDERCKEAERILRARHHHIPDVGKGDWGKLARLTHPDQRANLTDDDYNECFYIVKKLRPYITTQKEENMADEFREAVELAKKAREAKKAKRKKGL